MYKQSISIENNALLFMPYMAEDQFIALKIVLDDDVHIWQWKQILIFRDKA